MPTFFNKKIAMKQSEFLKWLKAQGVKTVIYEVSKTEKEMAKNQTLIQIKHRIKRAEKKKNSKRAQDIQEDTQRNK